jgi:hypothetical protein
VVVEDQVVVEDPAVAEASSEEEVPALREVPQHIPLQPCIINRELQCKLLLCKAAVV